ncbi:MAG: bifunctional oligoribonuclease/PAP phosphatase NrnA [Bacteroidetes bacterium]|nr:bifunctional oligoribonuclease/PAP phosphatase NrnA [Bacteroidota bacterium]
MPSLNFEAYLLEGLMLSVAFAYRTNFQKRHRVSLSFKFMPNNLHSLLNALSQPLRILITTHHKPDADALGSSLGWAHILQARGHAVTVVVPNDFPGFLDWMPGTTSVLDYEQSQDKALKALQEADLVCCLDFNDLKRNNELGQKIEQSGKPILMVDHHPYPKDFATYSYHKVEASSTCELILDLCKELGWMDAVSLDAGTCLYAGLVTDTGSFRFPSCTPNTHRWAAYLLEMGVRHFQVHEAIFDQTPVEILRFLGHCFLNRLKVLPEWHTAYIVIPQQDLKDFGVRTGDTEGLVNYALNLKGMRFASVIIDRGVQVKMSFRSKGKVPANLFAIQYFEGGGHLNAAGGQSRDTLEQTEARFLTAMESFAPDHLR